MCEFIWARSLVNVWVNGCRDFSKQFKGEFLGEFVGVVMG